MELVRKNIHMNRQKCEGNVQITLDNDLNVPDIKPDIKSIITEQGDIKLQEVRSINGRVMVKGSLMYHMLYTSEEESERVQCMNGVIEFDEVVNMNDVCMGDTVSARCEMEDLTTDIINSRKISVKAILNITTSVEEIFDEQAVVDIEGDDSIQKLDANRKITELCLSNKDIFRIKEEIRIPVGRDSIREIIYHNITAEGLETRLIQDNLSIRGELRIFVLYIGVQDERVNSYETNVSFQGEVACNGCNEGMISKVNIGIQDKDIQIKADEDGEDRILDIEAVLALDMKVYNREEINLLADMYSTQVSISPVYRTTFIDNLIIKNDCKFRITDRLNLEQDCPKVMQICNASGSVRIDDRNIVNDGIEVEGILEVKVVYFTEENEDLLSSYTGIIPFVQTIDAKGIHEDCSYELSGVVDSINVMVIDETVIEVKAVAGLDIIVFEKDEFPVITDWQITEKDINSAGNMPGIIGYVVGNDDTLWSIAKENGVTMNDIMEMNELQDEHISKGQKLLLVKKI